MDLRQELIKILDGDLYNPHAVSVPMIHRVLDASKRCKCNNKDVGGVADTYCSYCDSEGYYWTEHAVKGYVSQGVLAIRSGDVKMRDIFKPLVMEQIDASILFLRWSELPPKLGDKFYQLRLNSDGSVYYRLDNTGKRYFERVGKFLTEDVSRLYGDDSELIFYRMVLRKDLTWNENRFGNKRY